MLMIIVPNLHQSDEESTPRSKASDQETEQEGRPVDHWVSLGPTSVVCIPVTPPGLVQKQTTRSRVRGGKKQTNKKNK